MVRQQVPDHILNNAALAAAMSVLPVNYNFEIHKTVWRIQQAGAKQVALQFPEGLLMYACTIADILQEFAGEKAFFFGALCSVGLGGCCLSAVRCSTVLINHTILFPLLLTV